MRLVDVVAVVYAVTVGVRQAFVGAATCAWLLAGCSARSVTASDGDESTSSGSASGGSASGGSTSSGSSSAGSTGSGGSTGGGGSTDSGGSASSGSASGSDGTTDATAGDGGAFIAEPDAAHPILPPPCDPASVQRMDCDPLLQDCPGDEKCTPWGYAGASWHNFRCAPLASDPKDVGETCRVFGAPNAGCDDCVARAMCLFVPGSDGEGVCVGFCEHSQGDYVCSEDGKVCAMANAGALPLCLDSCNPLAPACPHGPGCLYVYDIQDFACAPPWTSMGYGEPCSTELGTCAPGLACVTSDGFPAGACASMCCTAACDLSAPNACPDAQDGQVCTALYDPGEAPPGNENVGLCRIP